jgi:hypothetical protein
MEFSKPQIRFRPRLSPPHKAVRIETYVQYKVDVVGDNLRKDACVMVVALLI